MRTRLRTIKKNELQRELDNIQKLKSLFKNEN